MTPLPVDRRHARSSTSPWPWSSDADALTATLEYNTDLFDAATIDAAGCATSQTLLAGIVADARGRRLSELPLLTAAERRAAPADVERQRRAPARRTVCVHELFEAAGGARARRRRRWSSTTSRLDATASSTPAPTSWPTPARARRRPGRLVGALHGAFARAGRGAARRPQGGRRLRARRSPPPGRPAGLRARGHARARARLERGDRARGRFRRASGSCGSTVTRPALAGERRRTQRP